MTSMASTSRQLRPQNFVLSSPTEFPSNPNEPRVLSVGTAVPSTVIAQEQTRSLIRTPFAAGAAAVIVGPGAGPALVGSYSALLDDTEDIMGWDLNDSGMKVRFSKDVPALVGEVLRSNMTEAAEANELSVENIKHFVTHPGGLKVLQTHTETLGLDQSALEDSYAVLASFGNMSSVSVLFVLERFMRRWAKLPAGEIGAVSAMGPGFSVEHVFFRT